MVTGNGGKNGGTAVAKMAALVTVTLALSGWAGANRSEINRVDVEQHDTAVRVEGFDRRVDEMNTKLDRLLSKTDDIQAAVIRLIVLEEKE